MVRVFLSCVSNEFRAYRELHRQQLATAGVEPVVQEHFADSNSPILERLDAKVKGSDFVIHLVGVGTGFRPKDGLPGYPSEVEQFLAQRDRVEFLRTSGLVGPPPAAAGGPTRGCSPRSHSSPSGSSSAAATSVSRSAAARSCACRSRCVHASG